VRVVVVFVVSFIIINAAHSIYILAKSKEMKKRKINIPLHTYEIWTHFRSKT